MSVNTSTLLKLITEFDAFCNGDPLPCENCSENAEFIYYCDNITNPHFGKRCIEHEVNDSYCECGSGSATGGFILDSFSRSDKYAKTHDLIGGVKKFLNSKTTCESCDKIATRLYFCTSMNLTPRCDDHFQIINQETDENCICQDEDCWAFWECIDNNGNVINVD